MKRPCAREGGPLASCRACPRLAAFRDANARRFPDWHNAPVPAIGDPSAELLVVGLAPGLAGADRTGVPFSGDESGEWLWRALRDEGLARRCGVAVTNAVKCVPPANRPTAAEIARCRAHLRADLSAFPRVRVVVALGRIAHEAVLAALAERHPGIRPRAFAFRHAHVHRLPGGAPILLDSFHPSPRNTRTGRLGGRAWRRVWAAAARLVRERWFVYVARCGDGTLYTGVTTDPVRRRAEHAAGRGARYTRGRGPVEIVHLEEATSKGDALRREIAIKKLRRRAKDRLVAGRLAFSPAG